MNLNDTHLFIHFVVLLAETEKLDTVTVEITNEAHFLNKYSNDMKDEKKATTSQKSISFEV
jgi:hypothetical protein